MLSRPPRGGWLPLARLMRLPNVFTAPPDVLMGFGLVTAWGTSPRSLGFAVAASVLLYASGMVWNDVFDIETDRRERPFRPLPSGAISLSFALVLAAVLMASGIGLAFICDRRTGYVALALAAAILTYNGLVKRWFFAPMVMGICRSLNVGLGAQAAMGVEVVNPEYGLVEIAAWANGLYIIGITTFARQEATTSSRGLLGLGVALAAMGVMPHVLQWGSHHGWTPFVVAIAVGFVLMVGIPFARALMRPEPALVQAGVKYGIWGLVLLNAGTTACFAGTTEALVILAHLPPMYWIGRKIYST